MNHKKLKIFSGGANLPLSREIAKYLQEPLGNMHISRFKDGEVYVRIEENVRGCDVFVIQPTSRYVNQNLMELAIIIDAMKRASAERVTAVMPYYGYARQDRKTKPREPITAKLVANLMVAAGADRVLTVDLHAGQIMGFFDIPMDHLTAVPLLANYFRNKKIPNLVIVSPDAGGAKRARQLAKILRVPIAIIDKRREEHNEVAEMYVVGKVKGKNCIIIDDMIDTGGTISEASKTLKEKGAKEIYVCATHPILSDPALKRLSDKSITEIVITNSINHVGKKLLPKITIISLGSLLGECIKRIHSDKSVSGLFEETLGKDNTTLKRF